ncbi:transport and Golgi organization protein 1 homolog isoform X1 [Oryctolagus cuniculus]|uniref:transport and Golgi organization protein 1 homolog isoform X1 n=1 Tax=Oryctolagus cuniculus TaxID=9986 RepID=UPI00387A0462
MEVCRRIFWMFLLGFLSPSNWNIGYVVGFFPKPFNQLLQDYSKEDTDFPSKLVHVPPSHFHLGLQCFEIPWKSIIIVSLVISAFSIFSRRTGLAYSLLEPAGTPRKKTHTKNDSLHVMGIPWHCAASPFPHRASWNSSVTASVFRGVLIPHENCDLDNDRKAEDMNNLVNDLIQSIYAKLPPGTDLNAQNHDLSTEYHDEAKEAKWEALRSSICELEEDKKNLEDSCHTLSSALAEKEADYKLLKMTLNSLYENYAQRKMTLTRELARQQQEQMESERQLLEKEENLKLAEEELQKYKRKIQELQARQERQRSMFRNQLRACAFEQEVMERRKELVYLQHRWEMMEMQRLAEGSWRRMPALGRMTWGSPPGRVLNLLAFQDKHFEIQRGARATLSMLWR